MGENKRILKLVIEGADSRAEQELLHAMKDLRDSAQAELDGDISLTSERVETIEAEFDRAGDGDV